jgi:hypothetical protein
MQRFVLKSFAFGLLLLCVFNLHAQQAASITGIVTDSTGAVIPGATVLLENPSTSVHYTGITSEVGSYTITNVRPGPGYTLTVTREGFKPVEITGIYMNVAASRTQSVQLKVGPTSQSVQVTADTETVTLNTTDATVGNNFEVQFLNELPIQNRDSPAALFTQQPGVTLDGAVTGARVDQNNVTLDGLDVNDMATGNFGAIVGHAPVDSVQEFRGVAAGQLASAGQGGGGQYELVTRSGTNDWHGALVEYHRDTVTEANDWFNNNDGVARPPLIRNQFGGNIGGPIKKDKAFFFFDYNGRRDTLTTLVERLVPTDSYRNGILTYYTNYANRTTAALSPSQIAALDPQGAGYNPAILKVFSDRYPKANDLNFGDRINSAGFRFNAPYPYVENNYVARVDYNLSDAQKLWGRLTFARTDATQTAIQFPGDPQTHPFFDKSYGWVVGHTWLLGTNMTNQAAWGETVTDYNFPNSFNPTGINQYTNGWGGTGTGGTMFDGPYGSAVNAQSRIYPIPVIRDDFSWLKGTHTFQIGGTFKYVNPSSKTFLNYNSPTIGLGGNMNALDSALRPEDIDSSSSTATARFDRAFALALGRFANVSSTFNYDAKGNILKQGSGSSEDYRYYETELYFGDTWKMTPSFTLSYGVRWQNYSVPYEKNGIQSVPNMGFDEYFGARVTQSALSLSGPSTDCAHSGNGVPCVSYSLAGKANGAPGYFNPQYTNFAPRVAFAWSPGAARKTVWSGGAGIVYDHTVVNAVQYQASQYSYLFQSNVNEPYGVSGDAYTSLLNDPRFTGFDNPPAQPSAPAAIKSPFTPYVDSDGFPFGLANGQAFNEGVDKFLKTPYSISYNLGFQHEFPGGMLFKTTWVGRLGRRLLAQADANQLIEFVDPKSGQSMSAAFGNMTQELRDNPGMNPLHVTPQPFFENVTTVPGWGAKHGYGSNTAVLTYNFGDYIARGDFADVMQIDSSIGFLPDNVGMGSQFSEFTYYTNKGFSNYNGMLATLHKNAGHGLQFDLNYTWSHSIDNVSIIANSPAVGGYGFICDVLRPRLCRGNSDFDVTQYMNGNFIYELPVGRGQTYGANVPFWVNELVGGWSISGLPSWHTGNAYFASSNAFVAGYANNAPAILTGSMGTMQAEVHKDEASGTVYAFKDPSAALNSFVGPIGFQIGSRNNLRGPGYFNLDLGLGKTFPVWREKVNLKFRADAFNALNHPNFSLPNHDISEFAGPFGVISSTVNSPRVLQGSLRLEF